MYARNANGLVYAGDLNSIRTINTVYILGTFPPTIVVRSMYYWMTLISAPNIRQSIFHITNNARIFFTRFDKRHSTGNGHKDMAQSAMITILSI